MKEPSRQDIFKMFDAISSTYDRVNRAMTLGLDLYWRKKLASLVPERESLALLDAATGTGDQILSLMHSSKPIERAVGIDLAEEMLKIGRAKIAKAGLGQKVSLEAASVADIPYPHGSFDCATISFGIRNVTDVAASLAELHRVLKSRGRLLVLEASLPHNRVLKALHLFYLRQILPRIGGLISKHKDAYVYLNETIETFPCGEAFCDLMRKAGFVQVKAYPLTGGIVTVYTGDKA